MSEQAGSYVRKQSYRLQFHADRDGIAKVVEFFAADLTYAWELIKGDASHRDVDVWEDGRLVCQVSHDPSAVRLSRPAARAEPLDGFYRRGGCG